MADDMDHARTPAAPAPETFNLNDLVHATAFGEASASTFLNESDLGPTASHTVSPEEVFLQHPPGSTSMTNFTTPSLYDGSPDTDFETSPMISGNDYGSGGTNHWPSLFPEVSHDSGYAPHKENVSDESLLAPLDAAAAPMQRTESSSSMDFKTPLSPADGMRHRHSLISGINKTKRSGRSLGPIDIDHNDMAAVKRAKNTLAARKSRQKKRDIEDALRVELERMTQLRDYWMHKAIARGEPPPRPGFEPDV